MLGLVYLGKNSGLLTPRLKIRHAASRSLLRNVFLQTLGQDARLKAGH